MTHTRRSAIASLLLNGMVLALMMFTAYRTVDFISLTLPADQQLWGYLALVAFDGGLLLWTLYYLHGAKGAWQRGISLLMVGVSLIGVIVAFGADTLYQTQVNGLGTVISPDSLRSAIWVTTGIIACNIGAFIGVHISDPEKLREQAEAEAQDKVISEAIRRIGAGANTLAAEVAPLLAADWLDRMRSTMTQGLRQTDYVRVSDLDNQVKQLVATTHANGFASESPALPQQPYTGVCEGCQQPIVGGHPRKYHDEVCRRRAKKARRQNREQVVLGPIGETEA